MYAGDSNAPVLLHIRILWEQCNVTQAQSAILFQYTFLSKSASCSSWSSSRLFHALNKTTLLVHSLGSVMSTTFNREWSMRLASSLSPLVTCHSLCPALRVELSSVVVLVTVFCRCLAPAEGWGWSTGWTRAGGRRRGQRQWARCGTQARPITVRRGRGGGAREQPHGSSFTSTAEA